MHIHLDAVGGVAGDMFIAAMLDAFPDLRNGLLAAVRAAGLPASIHAGLAEHRDHALTGLRFRVIEPIEPQALVSAHHHPHTPFTEIRDHLTRSALGPRIREHAIGLFTTLGEAEAQVHGKTMDEVSFHELGEWDSIADMVGAAYLIDALSPATWSVGNLPLGRGRVATAHGRLPIPSPAATLLLKGFEFTDDGLEGERITPTGAAILKYLRCSQTADRQPRRLMRTGIGFGTRTFPGISNVLRLLAFEESTVAPSGDHVAQILFEVDDQSPEDLAIALDKLRAHPSVLDVLQTPAFGKKGRITLHIQILAEPADLESVFEACFSETTTLGLRYQVLQRRILSRSSTTIEAEGRKLRVKVAERPGTKTAKIEADDLLNLRGGRAAREELKQQAEKVVLRKDRT
jgi:pyridinium-3,5-bisthiocarboxylic acid mononucleotide nickel chelatase